MGSIWIDSTQSNPLVNPQVYIIPWHFHSNPPVTIWANHPAYEPNIGHFEANPSLFIAFELACACTKLHLCSLFTNLFYLPGIAFRDWGSSPIAYGTDRVCDGAGTSMEWEGTNLYTEGGYWRTIPFTEYTGFNIRNRSFRSVITIPLPQMKKAVIHLIILYIVFRNRENRDG